MIKSFPRLAVLAAVLALTLLGAGCSQLTPTVKQAAPVGQPGVNQAPSPAGATLDLSNQGLTELPKYVLGMTELQELNLSHNRLTGALPAEIRFLKNLRKLNLSYNDMTGVPAEVGQLSQLQTLDLSYNRFTGLPYELGNLSNLKVLSLTGNNYAQADLNIILSHIPNVRVIK